MIIKLKSNRKEMVEGLTPEFPYVLHRADLGTMRVPWHWHEEVEFNYVEKGSVELSTTDQKLLPGRRGLFHQYQCALRDAGKDG